MGEHCWQVHSAALQWCLLQLAQATEHMGQTEVKHASKHAAAANTYQNTWGNVSPL
jgi:hypothetical protein